MTKSNGQNSESWRNIENRYLLSDDGINAWNFFFLNLYSKKIIRYFDSRYFDVRYFAVRYFEVRYFDPSMICVSKFYTFEIHILGIFFFGILGNKNISYSPFFISKMSPFYVCKIYILFIQSTYCLKMYFRINKRSNK